jgi:DoxX-like protein
MSAIFLDSATTTAQAPADVSAAARSAGRAATGIAVLFIVFDTAVKLVSAKAAVDATVQLGYAPHHVLAIGLIELACLALYLVPRTAFIGAVIWTGYLGGAVASNVRLDNPLFSHTLFPVYMAALLWGGLYSRDTRLRALFARRPSVQR